MYVGAVLAQQYNNCKQADIRHRMIEDALFELLSLECRVTDGAVYYYNALGRIHRVHGPAVIYSDGSEFWYQDGRLHRLDAPAIVRPDGYRSWYQNGQRHRLDGPAIERADGGRAWYQNGQQHRVDGPAVDRPDGYRAWYINGKELTEAVWQRAAASMETV